jgi:transcriptional regulator with XRE-family HTH domain
MVETKRKPRTGAIDRHVGARVRERRKALGLSQEVLARSLGIAFQQLQKYETGANRIGAAMLFEIACRLSVPVSAFYDGLSAAGPTPQASALWRQFERLAATREGADLVRLFPRIEESRSRRAVVEIVRVMISCPHR